VIAGCSTEGLPLPETLDFLNYAKGQRKLAFFYDKGFLLRGEREIIFHHLDLIRGDGSGREIR
jgi:hypothetical protein